MAENAYLDGAGVAQLWDATKDYVSTHAAQPEVTSGTEDEAAWLTRETAAGFPCGGRATVRSIKGHSEVVDGSLVSAKPTGIESEDADGNAIGSISIPIDQIAPNGLRSAGSAYDELTADALVTRIGAVDLGTLTWQWHEDTRLDTGGFFQSENLTDLKTGSVNKECSDYTVIRDKVGLTNIISAYGSSVDKVTFSAVTSLAVFVVDSAYTDAATFKAAMDGVLLFYELATPTTQAIDPPLNFTYRTEAGGTETVTHAEATSAPTLDVVYEIDGTAAAASIAPLEGRVASTNYSLGSLIMLGGTLVKVTTAIATGEQIIIGQNVTATTVAAELAALA